MIAEFKVKRLAEEVQAQRMELQAKDAELQIRDAELGDLRKKMGDMLLRHQEESVELRTWL